jgi:histone H3/H4
MEMKTGFDAAVSEDTAVQEMVSISTSMFLVLLEDAMQSAGDYAAVTGRNIITSTDMRYGMRYQARNTHQIKDMHTRSKMALDDLNECASESDDSDDDCVDEPVDEEEEEHFERAPDSYSEYITHMNYCHDTWDDWVPETDAECLLKKSIDLKLT